MKPHDTTSSHLARDDGRKAEIKRDMAQTGAVLSTSETVSRFGSANAEYIKGYTGIDNETGQNFAKGLAGIAQHKVHPDYVNANLKQQAGFCAEVAATSRDNAEAIIARSEVRTARSDDLPQHYPKNHNVVDRVQILDGQIIEGSQTQMKFVGNPRQLLKDIAKEDGKFARYRGTRIELPSEQYKDAAQHCRDQAQQLRINAQHAELHGKADAAAKLRREAKNYERLASDVCDSGMTTEQAMFYRKHPEIATALDIAHTSHRAGGEGARYGAVIGSCISLLQNLLATAQGKQDLRGAAQAVAADTAKAGAIGYGTAFAGSAIKASMQQSGSQALRTLSRTNAPALALNICLSLGGSVKRFVTGEITESQLLVEVGEKGAGMLSGSMMAALGQLAIPVPFVGAAVGGLIGYSLSSLFYQSALDAARGAEVSRELLARTQAIESSARARIAEERLALDEFFAREIPDLCQETQRLLAAMDASTNSPPDALIAAIDQYGTLLGKRLQFQSMAEFDDFMLSDQPLRL
ncbi:hypothetical protein [Alicycliphilus denitrificans]|uniref:hypothetical protein n=1 Tax=Alicycliphilus denitrificans TaxID=179636 RepID=UPI00384AE775